MNAYLWFQFGSFAYGFSGRVVSSQAAKLGQINSAAHAVVELDPPETESFDLPNFVESILDTSKHLLRVDVCFHSDAQNKSNKSYFEQRFVTRHLPELVLAGSSVKLKLVELEPKLDKPLKGQKTL
jgi:hypothetical protein